MPVPIIDEWCVCGHLRSKHGPQVIKLSITNTPLRVFVQGAITEIQPKIYTEVQGHGPCNKCNCRKFTWKGFVYQGEETSAPRIS